jgi:hypothetical protein
MRVRRELAGEDETHGGPPDIEAATLEDGDPIEVFIFGAWRRAVFHRIHGVPFVEVDSPLDERRALQAGNRSIIRVRRRWDA